MGHSRALREVSDGSVTARLTFLSLLIGTAVINGLLVPATASPAAAPNRATTAAVTVAAPQSGRIVDDDPAGFTPHVMDGAVFSMTQVGDVIVVGGSFTRVRNAGTTTDIPRRNLFAFNAATGQVSTGFAPDPNGTVYALESAADGQSVYVGGSFGTITSGGSTVSVSNLFRADIASGSRIAQFQTGTLNGSVRDLALSGSRLWLAGKFTHVQGKARRALATVDASTGVVDAYYDRVIAGVHRADSVTNVLKIALNPARTRLVAIGNFDTVDGVRRHQLAVLDLGTDAATLADFRTTQFESPCSASFETYMTDVNWSPDGRFFVVSTTGAYGGYAASMAGTSGCDVVTRFEASASGAAVTPTWTAYTGGDTTWTIEVTDDVVYAGGHQRWQNNPARGDAADEGAVSRPGIAALSTRTGMPYSWNPTRTLGAGVRDMVATSAGLFVGSDTDVFAGETHRKVAFLPLSSGRVLPPTQDATLPGDVFRVATSQSQLLRRGFDGNQVTSSSDAPNGTGWGTSVGAFMVDGDLYTAYANRTLTRRTFDGTTYGTAVTIDTADQLVYQDDWHNGDVPLITTLFYDRGWIYFTELGSSQLFRRGFEPESGVVGQQRFAVNSVTGVSYSSMRGAFVAGGQLYFAASNGSLSRAQWSAHGAVAGTATTIAPTGSGWSSRAMFLYQGPAIPPPVNAAPTASFTVTCSGLSCAFDATASTDSDGSVQGYAWDFGDGQQGQAGPTTTHTYAAGGPATVSLTVTDGELTGTTTRTAQPAGAASPIAAVASASTAGNRLSHRTTVPAAVQPGDLLLAFLVANTTTPSYPAPPGWIEIENADAGTKAAGRLYVRIAGTSDAGSPVTVTSSGYAKSVLTVAAYRGVHLTQPVGDSAVAVQSTAATSHVTPAVSAPDATRWLVSYWADKSTDSTGWTLPGGVVQRSAATGTGSGHITGVLGDSGGPVPAGTRGGLTAVADASGTAAVTFSVLVAPSS
jgi:PKD repeat protein